MKPRGFSDILHFSVEEGEKTIFNGKAKNVEEIDEVWRRIKKKFS